MADKPTRGGQLPRVVLLVFALAFASGPLLRPLVRPYAYSDFVTYYSAARCFATGGDPYDADSLRASGAPTFEGWIGRYLYPPPFAAVVIRPLAQIPFEWSRRIWVVVEALAYAIALGVFAKLLLPELPAWRDAIVAALGGVYAPMALDLKLGSVSGVLLLLIALFFRERRRGRLLRAGLLLASAVLLKLSPLLLLAYLGLRGEWRLVRQTLLAGVLLVVLCLPWTGMQAFVDYGTRVLPFIASANFSWFTNQSVDAFFWRMLVPNPDSVPYIVSPALHRVATVTVGTLLLGGLVAVAYRARRRNEATFAALAWEMALALVAALLLARVSWEYMLVLALPCFILWAGALHERRVARSTSIGVALAYVLCAFPFPYAEAPLREGPGLLLMTPRTYGLMILYWLTWWRLVRGGGPGGLPEDGGRTSGSR